MSDSNDEAGSPPMIPDVKPSRGDDIHKDDEKRRKSKSHHHHGHHHHSSSSDHHHHSSSEGHRNSSFHSSYESSPRRSSHSRRSSISRTPDSSKQSKQKLRLAEAGASTNHSPLFLSSPGATSVSSRSSSRRHSSTPESKKDHSKRQLRLTEMEESDIAWPPLATRCGATSHAVSVPDTPALEATAAPDMAGEIEAARRRGREEGRSERRIRGDGILDTNDTVIVATPVPKDNTAKKHACVALVGVLIAVAVTIWLLLSRKAIIQAPSENTNAVQEFDPPTDEDCLNISKGLPVGGQDQATAKTIGVEMEFVVASEVDLALLKAELQAKIQRDVLPALAGCESKGLSVVGNNHIVANAILNAIFVGEPLRCREMEEELCSTVDMELEVFLRRDDDVSNETLVNLVYKVFEEEGLLEFLSLASPVEDAYVRQVIKIDDPINSPPSQNPSSNTPDASAPSQETCEAIATGKSVPGQQDMAVQEYDILMDVMLDSEVELLVPVTIELEEKLQEFLMPSLAGCTTTRRLMSDQHQQWIVNALVDVVAIVDGECLPESTSPCHRYVAHLFIYISSIVSSADFSESIHAEFRKEPLVQRLNLSSLFKRVIIVSKELEEETPASNPTAFPSTRSPTQMPSTDPTRAPVTYPTTDEPTRSPTVKPSVHPTSAPVAYPTTESPTAAPTRLPTPVPTKEPTPIPTPQPVVGPTTEPTSFPTKRPSSSPTPAPSPSPTTHPSAGPTRIPTFKPSRLPTTEPTPAPTSRPSVSPTSKPSRSPTLEPTSPPTFAPTFAPTPSPSPEPTARPCFESNSELALGAGRWFQSYYKPMIEADYGLIGDWCFGPSVTSMEGIFRYKEDFREDISRWNVSSITNMKEMFRGAKHFNIDIGMWDVSSVTTMEWMFDGAWDFNQNIGGWDVSSVTNMREMFQQALSFNQNIGNWDVSLVQDMSGMFRDAYDFNQPIDAWQVTSVTDMTEMFKLATSFNQDIGQWRVYSVQSTRGMFFSATSFNQDISDWKLTSNGNMRNMFEGASSFNQNLCEWKLHVYLSDYFHMNYRAFADTNCPTEVDPENGLGPFCYVCE